jgi:carbamoyltransferase
MLVLGINYGSGHDSSAALAVDGEIKFAIAEERISRFKHDGRFPKLALEACLAHGGASMTDVDAIVCGWQPPAEILRQDAKNFLIGSHPMSPFSAIRYLASGSLNAWRNSGERILARYFGSAVKKPLQRIDHHYAHALSAYAVSGVDHATVVVVDGRGAWEATTIWHGRGGELSLLGKIRWPNSIGLFYAEFTGYLGFEKYQDEWKVMGLAPYGSPGFDLSEFIRIENGSYNVDSRRLLRDPQTFSGIVEKLGPARRPQDPIEDRHRAIAWAVQDCCERAETAVMTTAMALTGSRNLCLAGGVALNSKANGLFLQQGIADRIFVQPAASDDGVALGAALAPAINNSGRLHEMTHAYLGQETEPAEIESILRTYKLPYKVLANPSETGAQLLADGKLLGWYQGRGEFGPRALGNRSILADPRDVKNRDRVNNAVKFREEWRPFAPSVLEEVGDEYFEHFQSSPFMTLTFQVRPTRRTRIAAAVHVDGSARVQSVNRRQNERYYDLIENFGKITGVPVLLNTSFNLKGEPIVNSPFDAIRTFFTSGLDFLILDRYLIAKSQFIKVAEVASTVQMA